MEKELDVQRNFWRKYRVPILIFVVISVVGYIGTYLIFRGDGFIPVGKDLTKSDWLSFLGAYLSLSLILMDVSGFGLHNLAALEIYKSARFLK